MEKRQALCGSRSGSLLPLTLLAFSVLAGCVDVPEPMRPILLEAPSQVALGEEVQVEWRVEGMPAGDPYRTGIHYSRSSTAHVSNDKLGLHHLPGSTAHEMGNGSGEFSVGFHPLETGSLFYRLHVERHNVFIWSDELRLEVVEPEQPAILVDRDRLPAYARANQTVEVWVVSAPTTAQTVGTEIIASYPGGDVVVGHHSDNASGAYAMQVRFPEAEQAISIHAVVTLQNGQKVVSPTEKLQVIHPDGALGKMVGGQLAAQVGETFSLYWRIEGADGPLGHNDIHWEMASAPGARDDPHALRHNSTPEWDATNQVYRVTITGEEVGFLFARIHTDTKGVETWSRIYGIEIYPD